MYNYLANDNNDLLLENLLPSCNILNISTSRKQKTTKETNWKQKFRKPQNENICLTYLNMENKLNFHFMSFGESPHEVFETVISGGKRHSFCTKKKQLGWFVSDVLIIK